MKWMIRNSLSMDESCYFGGKRTIESHDVSPELLVLCGVDEMEGVDS